jgi:thiol-disulfide isomerase/thioredoxin
MHKKTILLVLALLCLAVTGFGQSTNNIKPLFIDGMLPNISFHNVINYKDSVATISDFQGKEKKLILFDFWNTHCTVCIEQFPKEEALQKLYGQNLQFVLVTRDSKKLVNDFLARYEKPHHTKITLPIIAEDTILGKYIRFFYQPQFAWVDFLNRLIAQTNQYFLNPQSIDQALRAIQAQKATFKTIEQERIKDSLRDARQKH